MDEKLLKVNDLVINNDNLVITLIRKNNYYILEKCIVNSNVINLIYKKKFNSYEKALCQFKKMKA